MLLLLIPIGSTVEGNGNFKNINMNSNLEVDMNIQIKNIHEEEPESLP